MAVHRIEDAHRRKVEAVVDDLAHIARTEGASSILFIMETPQRREPVVGVMGRLRADPQRAIGQLSVVQRILVKMAARGMAFADSSL